MLKTKKEATVGKQTTQDNKAEKMTFSQFYNQVLDYNSEYKKAEKKGELGTPAIKENLDRKANELEKECKDITTKEKERVGLEESRIKKTGKKVFRALVGTFASLGAILGTISIIQGKEDNPFWVVFTAALFYTLGTALHGIFYKLPNWIYTNGLEKRLKRVHSVFPNTAVKFEKKPKASFSSSYTHGSVSAYSTSYFGSSYDNKIARGMANHIEYLQRRASETLEGKLKEHLEEYGTVYKTLPGLWESRKKQIEEQYMDNQKDVQRQLSSEGLRETARQMEMEKRIHEDDRRRAEEFDASPKWEHIFRKAPPGSKCECKHCIAQRQGPGIWAG